MSDFEKNRFLAPSHALYRLKGRQKAVFNPIFRLSWIRLKPTVLGQFWQIFRLEVVPSRVEAQKRLNRREGPKTPQIQAVCTYPETSKSRFWRGPTSAVETFQELKFVLSTSLFGFCFWRKFQPKRTKPRGNTDPPKS